MSDTKTWKLNIKVKLGVYLPMQDEFPENLSTADYNCDGGQIVRDLSNGLPIDDIHHTSSITTG
jgi:hypothetical protein